MLYYRAKKISVFAVLIVLVLILSKPNIAFTYSMDDSQITSEIKTRLFFDQNVAMRSVDVNTDDFVVELTGKVNTLLEKERAYKIAYYTDGVVKVVNKLNLEEFDVTDLHLEEIISKLIENDPVTMDRDINVDVEKGKVTLTGFVESIPERTHAGHIAKGTKGVQSVSNDLALKVTRNRPDSELFYDITARISSDPRLEYNVIDIAVDNGHVDINGVVEDEMDKIVAKASAWVLGTKSVNAEDLKVTKDESETIMVDKPYTISDNVVHYNIRQEFRRNPYIRSRDIDITVKNGRVELSGSVDNFRADIEAEAAARHVFGAVWVENNIEVEKHNLNDNTLKKNVRSALVRNKFADISEIDFSVDKGIVTLNGRVDTDYEKKQAEYSVLGVVGVLGVKNNLVAQNSYDYKSDKIIQIAVERNLLLHPEVDLTGIDISVENGIVTLNGNVPTAKHKIIAEDEAYDIGVKDVINKLVVNHKNKVE